jgi:hypothetical protein
MECDGGFYGDTLDVDERKARIGLMVAEASLKTAEANHKNVASQKELLAAYVSVCTHPDLDDLAKTAFKAGMIHAIYTPSKQILSCSAPDGRGLLGPADDLINISVVAADMGHQLSVKDLKAIGCLLSKAYMNKYGVKPNQREQLVQGNIMKVNSYTNRDIDLMQAAIV